MERWHGCWPLSNKKDLLLYCVVNVFTELMAPSLVPSASIESTR
jgi:hypothetical protein